jgi:Rrf2 family protein
MKLSNTTEYALRILSFMAMDEKLLYTANDLFDKLQIPYRYLRKQLNFLLKQGFLVSVQGKTGGYQIAKSLNDISLMDIIEATDDTKIENMCFFGFSECPLTHKCSMHEKWGEVRNATITLLKTTTLQDIKSENNTTNLSLININ